MCDATCTGKSDQCRYFSCHACRVCAEIPNFRASRACLGAPRKFTFCSPWCRRGNKHCFHCECQLCDFCEHEDNGIPSPPHLPPPPAPPLPPPRIPAPQHPPPPPPKPSPPPSRPPNPLPPYPDFPPPHRPPLPPPARHLTPLPGDYLASQSYTSPTPSLIMAKAAPPQPHAGTGSLAGVPTLPSKREPPPAMPPPCPPSRNPLHIIQEPSSPSHAGKDSLTMEGPMGGTHVVLSTPDSRKVVDQEVISIPLSFGMPGTSIFASQTLESESLLLVIQCGILLLVCFGCVAATYSYLHKRRLTPKHREMGTSELAWLAVDDEELLEGEICAT